MSRSGYDDECDGWRLICWRGAVNSAIRGHRGQAMLRELLAALDALPEKRLISDEITSDGSYCALGALGLARGLSLDTLDTIDPSDLTQLAETFGIAQALAAEVMYINDRHCTSDEERWNRVYAWARENLVTKD